MECRNVVELGLCCKGGTARIHDVLDMGCEKMREFKEDSSFVLCGEDTLGFCVTRNR